MSDGLTVEDLYPEPPKPKPPKPKPKPQPPPKPKSIAPPDDGAVPALIAEIQIPEPVDVWDQMPEEPAAAYGIFLIYLRLGFKRTMLGARDKWLEEWDDRPYTAKYIRGLASKWKWRPRTMAFDREVLSRRRTEYIVELEEARQIAVVNVAEITRHIAAIAKGEKPKDLETGKEIDPQVKVSDMIRAAEVIRDIVGLKAPDQKEITYNNRAVEAKAVPLNYDNLTIDQIREFKRLHRLLRGEAEPKAIEAEHEPVE